MGTHHIARAAFLHCLFISFSTCEIGLDIPAATDDEICALIVGYANPIRLRNQEELGISRYSSISKPPFYESNGSNAAVL